MFIQEHLEGAPEKADWIVCNDALDHILVTRERLTKSELFPDAVTLFKRLLGGWLGRATLCDRYFLTYRRP